MPKKLILIVAAAALACYLWKRKQDTAPVVAKADVWIRT